MIFLQRGHFFLGRTTRDRNGEIVEQHPQHFDPDPEGPCVVVGILNDETMEQEGSAELYGDYDAAGYLGKVLALMGHTRESTLPDFESIIRKMQECKRNEDCCLMSYCERPSCRGCVVKTWIEDEEDGSEDAGG